MFAIYSHAESLMLERVRRRVEKGILTNGWTEKKAKEVVAIREELSKLVNDVNKLAAKEVSQAIKQAYESGVKSANKDFKLPETVLTDYQIPASVQRLTMEANMMIVNTSVSILREATDVFRKIQAEVATGVLTGTETRKQIAQRMLNKFADKGVTSFVDKAGRRWEMATYAEMATRTVTARAAIQGHIDRQGQYGRDLVVVSDHAGECPLCRPWENKILSISGTDIRYPSLSSATSQGLFHPNCRHTVTGYIEGLTRLEPTRTSGVPEQFEYTQQQRANERQIRRWKRREIVAMGTPDAMLARAQIQFYQQKQRDLLKEYEAKFDMTLRRKYDRESINNRAGKLGTSTGPAWTDILPKTIPQAEPVKERKPRVKKEKVEEPIDITKYKNYTKQIKSYSNSNLNKIKDVAIHTNFINGLNDNQKHAIRRYTGQSYERINKWLRKGIREDSSDNTLDLISDLSKALKKSPELSENFIMRRHDKLTTIKHLFGEKAGALAEGALNNADDLINLRKMLGNATLQDKAFSSTSYIEGVFVRDYGVEIRYLLPKGYKEGLFVENHSFNRKELEYIINKDKEFRVIDVQVEEVREHRYEKGGNNRSTSTNIVITVVPK
jgi:hypothetical protein